MPPRGVKFTVALGIDPTQAFRAIRLTAKQISRLRSMGGNIPLNFQRLGGGSFALPKTAAIPGLNKGARVSGADFVRYGGAPLFGRTPTGKFASRALPAHMFRHEFAGLYGGMPRQQWNRMVQLRSLIPRQRGRRIMGEMAGAEGFLGKTFAMSRMAGGPSMFQSGVRKFMGVQQSGAQVGMLEGLIGGLSSTTRKAIGTFAILGRVGSMAFGGIGIAANVAFGVFKGGLGILKMGFGAVVGVAKGIGHVLMLPFTILGKMARMLTSIRHLFWNISFLIGMIGGGIYAAFKMLEPAAQREQWMRQFGILWAPDKQQGAGYRSGRERMFSGLAAGKQEMQWLAYQAPQLPFEVPEIIEAGKNMQLFGIYSRSAFMTVTDAAFAYQKSLDQVVRSLGYLSKGRYGEAMRMLMRLGISRPDLQRQGIQFKGRSPISKPEDQVRAVLNIWKGDIGGIAQTMTQTFKQVFSNLRDELFNLRMYGLMGLLPFATQIVEGVKDSIKSMRAGLSSIDWTGFGTKMAGGFATLTAMLGERRGQFAPVFGEVAKRGLGVAGLGVQAVGEAAMNIWGSRDVYLDYMMKALTSTLLSAAIKMGQIWVLFLKEAFIWFGQNILSSFTKIPFFGTFFDTAITTLGVQSMKIAGEKKALGRIIDHDQVAWNAKKKAGVQFRRDIAPVTGFGLGRKLGLIGEPLKTIGDEFKFQQGMSNLQRLAAYAPAVGMPMARRLIRRIEKGERPSEVLGGFPAQEEAWFTAQHAGLMGTGLTKTKGFWTVANRTPDELGDKRRMVYAGLAIQAGMRKFRTNKLDNRVIGYASMMAQRTSSGLPDLYARGLQGYRSDEMGEDISALTAIEGHTRELTEIRKQAENMSGSIRKGLDEVRNMLGKLGTMIGGASFDKAAMAN